MENSIISRDISNQQQRLHQQLTTHTHTQMSKNRRKIVKLLWTRDISQKLLSFKRKFLWIEQKKQLNTSTQIYTNHQRFISNCYSSEHSMVVFFNGFYFYLLNFFPRKSLTQSNWQFLILGHVCVYSPLLHEFRNNLIRLRK